MRELTPHELDAIRCFVAGDPGSSGAGSIDWNVLIECARTHRLGPLLHLQLEQSGHVAPEPARKRLAHAFHVELARSIVQHHHTLQLDALAVELERPLVLLKGSAFREMLYTHPATRPMADIDVLARPADIPAFVEAIERQGFSIHDSSDHATCFRHDRTGTYVELHRSLTSCARTLGVSVDSLIDRSVAAPEFSSFVRTLSVEDHLIHLCLHASFQHGFRQPAVNAWDARLLVARPEFSVETVLERCAGNGLAPWIAAGMWMSHSVFPSPELGGLIRELTRGRHARGKNAPKGPENPDDNPSVTLPQRHFRSSVSPFPVVR